MYPRSKRSLSSGRAQWVTPTRNAPEGTRSPRRMAAGGMAFCSIGHDWNPSRNRRPKAGEYRGWPADSALRNSLAWAWSSLVGVGLRRSGDQVHDHLRQPLVVIDAKTPVHHVGARSTTCGKVDVTSEEPATGCPPDNRFRIITQGDHQWEDPAAIPPLLWRFEHPCSKDLSRGGRTPTWLRDG